MDFSKALPINKPALWQLQQELMSEAEALFGTRDESKVIYQPDWHVDGPHIRYSANKDGAFAELSFAAQTNWRLAVYQLAHETVHLLDQHGGQQTILLEEGAAVRFSLDMMDKYGFSTAGLPSIRSYREALFLFNSLGAEPYKIMKNCRVGSLEFNGIDSAVLKSETKGLTSADIFKMLSKPKMR
ncbi:hypothetical protein L2726_004737 [Vibrio parahaemolyticus]|uniref:IrrE N-terminal-like domain-containing protein n=1 Tax=Vibrio alfacsensis TaxID=1074311 RepID=A0ABM6YUE2_9VIBR|nr:MULTISPECIES: hypothetical protein [Vibrio]AXY01308.1 hypothetical protein D1115_09130 [Vibrio alfacsensis]EIQ1514392.1 hypothetical protein [Vibrio parahaemolyticus]EIT7127095.1 hypothetical protein [Vibrio parahaemolyticus]EIT7132129.1 hypothetical protein [Vibrio parahaemolyticus]EIZ4252591.1 hypothetical protein [Vibrio parahaemolyticus]